MSDGVRWASRSSTGTVRIRMHNKLAALVALGKYLGMFDERRIAAIYAWREFPAAGGLMSYGASFTDARRRRTPYQSCS
jgi:hypothetical protein